MNKELPHYLKIFDIDKISDSLNLNKDIILREFKDGRVVSRFSEYWASELYGFSTNKNSNMPEHDGLIKTKSPLIDDFKISVKSLTSTGIKFQQSMYQGKGRFCNENDLIKSLKMVDFIICVDVNDFPCVYFSPCKCNELLELVKLKKITQSGLKREKFYLYVFKKHMSEINFIGDIKNFNLKINNKNSLFDFDK